MRYLEIDTIKGVCILLVFFQHSILGFPIDLNAQYCWCNWLTQVITSYYMPCFFVVSGFLYYGSKKSWGDTMKDKLHRLVLPYLTVCAIELSVKLFLPSYAFCAHDSLIDYANYYLLNGGDRWFLYVLFTVFLLWAPFKLQMLKAQTIAIVLMVLYAVVLTGVIGFYFFPISKCLFYSQFFLWGYMLRIFYIKIRPIFQNYYYVFMTFFILMNCILINQLDYWTRGIALPIIGTMFMFTVALCLEKSKKSFIIKCNDIFKYVGRYSLQFYVMTGFVLPVARILVVNIWHIQSPFIIIPSVFFIQVCFAYIGVRICEKIKPLNYLFGY